MPTDPISTGGLLIAEEKTGLRRRRSRPTVRFNLSFRELPFLGDPAS